MKKLLALFMALLLAAALVACGTEPTPPAEENEGEGTAVAIAKEDLKVGMVLISDKSDAYSGNHIEGMEKAMTDLGLNPETQLIMKQNVGESADCETAIRELAEAGCQVIFSNSFGHENYMVSVAPEFPEIQFCAATGYQSATDDMDNTHNYFARIYEARYLSGIAAGLKTETNKIGYVAAKPFAEVISGYTAFYLGAKSVNPDVEMYVNYTQEWSDAGKESTNAQALIDLGCDVIGQHSDTTAPATTAEGAGVFSVGYNADNIPAAPNAALTSARINWSVYYNYALNALLQGEAIEQDWCEGLASDAVYLSPLNEALVAEGTAEAIELAQQGILDGSIHVFDGPLVDVEGNTVVEEGSFYYENENSSAPTWDKILEGINVLS
ncbi:MAG: nucleoside-binding protein [Firmicutes bacterium]|nr:nucleoside-binding protein [Bacillota bacterium]